VKTLRLFALLLVCAAMTAIILRWISLERWRKRLAETVEEEPIRIVEPTPAPTPTPPRTQVIGGKLETSRLFSGITVNATVEPTPGGPASDERVDPQSYVLDLKLHARVPTPNKSIDELAKVNPELPHLLPGLARHPGIGWIMVRSRRLGPVVLGRAGRRLLLSGRIEGEDPLAGFGPAAAADLRRHDELPHTGDIVVNSGYDPVTQEVAAFEDLIGCHGGLGGWQDRPLLIHPAAWPVDGELTGADAVHRQLVRWLERFGDRAGPRTQARPGP